MTPLRDDRTVHAIRDDGVELVRYDRSGKWYIEHDRVRDHVTIAEAVSVARMWFHQYGEVRFGLPGGTAFDRKLRDLIA